MKERIRILAKEAGAAGVGMASVERLNGLASMDPAYLLPGAGSIISVMLPYDGDTVRRYLGKEDHIGFQQHETEVYRELYRISKAIEGFLISKGYQALACEPNLDYRHRDSREYRRIPYRLRQWNVDTMSSGRYPFLRPLKRKIAERFYLKDVAYVDWNLTPSFSHRYGAVACGLGSFGWSSNVMTPEYGARVLFNTVITSARLPSDPLMEQTPCDGCRLCTRVCQVGMMHPKEEDSVVIGGKRFVHAKKGHNLRCIFCCGGFTGQSLHPAWSTWSPGRIDLPETDHNIVDFWNQFALENVWQHNYYSKVLSDLVFHNEYGMIRKPFDRFQTTCGNCQLICWSQREERQENYDILVNSGQVVEGPGFSFRVVR